MTHILDVKDLRCPLPVLKARKKLIELQQGEHLLVLATDEGAWRDFPDFCEASGHILQKIHDNDGVIHIVIEKQ